MLPKVATCHAATLLLGYSCALLLTADLHPRSNPYLFALVVFFHVGSLQWTTALSFDTFFTFRSLKSMVVNLRSGHRRRLGAYAAYAGCVAACVAAAVGARTVPGSHALLPGPWPPLHVEACVVYAAAVLWTASVNLGLAAVATANVLRHRRDTQLARQHVTHSVSTSRLVARMAVRTVGSAWLLDVAHLVALASGGTAAGKALLLLHGVVFSLSYAFSARKLRPKPNQPRLSYRLALIAGKQNG